MDYDNNEQREEFLNKGIPQPIQGHGSAMYKDEANHKDGYYPKSSEVLERRGDLTRPQVEGKPATLADVDQAVRLAPSQVKPPALGSGPVFELSQKQHVALEIYKTIIASEGLELGIKQLNTAFTAAELFLHRGK